MTDTVVNKVQSGNWQFHMLTAPNGLLFGRGRTVGNI